MTLIKNNGYTQAIQRIDTNRDEKVTKQEVHALVEKVQNGMLSKTEAIASIEAANKLNLSTQAKGAKASSSFLNSQIEQIKEINPFPKPHPKEPEKITPFQIMDFDTPTPTIQSPPPALGSEAYQKLIGEGKAISIADVMESFEIPYLKKEMDSLREYILDTAGQYGQFGIIVGATLDTGIAVYAPTHLWDLIPGLKQSSKAAKQVVGGITRVVVDSKTFGQILEATKAKGIGKIPEAKPVSHLKPPTEISRGMVISSESLGSKLDS